MGDHPATGLEVKSAASARRRSAFTLVELMIVVMVVGILVMLLLPAIQAARESARRTQCHSNLAQVIIAVQGYELSHRVLPYGTLDAAKRIDNRPQGYHHGWISQILPQLEQTTAFRMIDRRVGVYHPRNVPVRTHGMQVLHCPSGWLAGSAHSNYAGVHNATETPIASTNNGVFVLNEAFRLKDVTDGSSQTLFVGEKQLDGGTDLGWMSGTRATLRNMSGGVNGLGLPLGAAAGGVNPVNDPATPGPVPANNRWELPGLPAGAQQIIERYDAGLEDYESVPASQLNPLGDGIESMGMSGMGMGGPDDIPSPLMEQGDELVQDQQAGEQEAEAAGGGPPKPGSNPILTVGGFTSAHPNGAMFAFGDGRVVFITEAADLVSLQQMANRSDGQLIRDRR